MLFIGDSHLLEECALSAYDSGNTSLGIPGRRAVAHRGPAFLDDFGFPAGQEAVVAIWLSECVADDDAVNDVASGDWGVRQDLSPR